MRIVIDTNVLISVLYFGGRPKMVLELLFEEYLEAYATPEIIEEYGDVYSRMEKKAGIKGDRVAFDATLARLKIIPDFPKVEASRDKDDDKFLSCAVNCKALYIVSGDDDLLVLEKFEETMIVTVADFLKAVAK